MDKIKIMEVVGTLLQDGESLSNILKILDTDYKQKMTFLELRLLASEIDDIDWTKNETPDIEEKEETTAAVSDTDTTGKTVVEVNKLTRPGIAMHGSVRFASGATADWVLNQMGQLGLEKSEGTPTKEDIQEFQDELQKTLGTGQ